MLNEPVHTIMTRNLITVKPEDFLSTVRQTFMNNSLHHLPVVEGEKIVGILTTYDLWKNEIAPENYSTAQVKEIMNTNIAKISPTDKIGTAAEVFLSNKFHALPVVDENNLLLGKPILFKDLYENQGSGHRAAS